MRRKEDRAIQKVTINLFEGDMEWLQATFPALGGSKIIREMVHTLRRRTEAGLPPFNPSAVKIEEVLQ